MSLFMHKLKAAMNVSESVINVYYVVIFAGFSVGLYQDYL